MEKRRKVIIIAMAIVTVFYNVTSHCFFQNQRQQQRQHNLNENVFVQAVNMANLVAIPLSVATFIGSYGVCGFELKNSLEAALSVFSGMCILIGYEYLRYCSDREQEQGENQNFREINGG